MTTPSRPGTRDLAERASLSLEGADVETALRAALARERELADMVEQAPIAIQWIATDGRILRANRAALELLGYSSDEYIGHRLAELHIDDAAMDELLGRLAAAERLQNYPARLRCKDGATVEVLIDSSPYLEGGRLIHTRCFSRPISGRPVEQAARAQQERFQLAARATQDLVWDWDLAGERVTWAGSTESFFGRAADAVALVPQDDYHVWATRVHPDDLAATKAASRAALASGAESWEHEYRFRRADGTWAAMLERAFIVRDPDGKPRRVVGSMQDITQRKESEHATRRLAAIVASSDDSIIGKTLDGVITSWNAAAERIFGYTEAEMVGQSVFRLIPEELHGQERALLERIRRGERVEYPDTQRIRKDGSRIDVSLTLSPIWGASGEIIGVSSIKRDITERKRAEAELARREERYRALVTATSSIVWTADPEGRFSEPQRSWEEYTGQPWPAHRGFGWLDALHPDDREAVRASWLEARNNGSSYQADGRVWSRRLEAYRHFVARAAPVLEPNGSVREWIGMVTDVEDHWAAEERLRQADRMESVGRLAGGIAHEANNQMTVILGATEFLLRQVRAPEVREDVQHIRRAAERTAAITQQLLAFSRRQILQPELLDLNVVITAMVPILQRALGEIAPLALRLATDLGKVAADRGQLEQILLNLALNARDAMPDGGTLTIETANVTLNERYVAAKGVTSLEAGPYVALIVSDTGRGMDRETLRHIFEPFFTTKDVGQGTGLGLSTVYGIVKQSGGFVWAYSEPGLGTAFKIYLPLAGETAGAPVEAPSSPVVGGNEVLLVAEDEPVVRSMLARSLRGYGYTVLEARDGDEAMGLIAQQPAPPDLIVIDVVMPGMGAKEISAEVARRWPSVPILFTSGYTGLDAAARGLLDTSRDFLQKPLEPEALARRVRQMLDARAGAVGTKLPS